MIDVINIYDKNDIRYVIYNSINKKIIIKENNKIIKYQIKKINEDISYICFKCNKNNSYYIEILDKNKIVYQKELKLDKMTYKTKFNHIPGLQIDLSAISGIIHPLLRIDGSSIYNNIIYKLMLDGKEIILDKNKKYFNINYELNRKIKKVKFIIDIDGINIEIVKIKNSLLKRIFNKIYKIVEKPINKIIIFFKLIIKGIKFLWREYKFLVPINMWKKFVLVFLDRLRNSYLNIYNPLNIEEYNKWLRKNEKETKITNLEYNPLISVVMPVYNVEEKLLRDCLNSILEQSYQNFEICISDDNSTNKETIKVLKEYENKDKRIKVKYRKENGNISVASNDALNLVTGKFVAMIDDDDVLDKNAFYEVVKVLNNNKDIDFIYTDEDKLNLEGKRCDPHFKPDYSPDTLLSTNYFCHLTVLRTSILKEIGGWRVGYEGAQDYDLFLRFVEKTTKDKIYHISKILYHWRMIKGSTSLSIDSKSYAIEKGKLALEDALKRRKIDGIVHIHEKVPYYWIEYNLNKEPSISIIIPTKDYADTLKTCVDSIYEKTTYKNFEIIIVNNGSVEKETYELFNKYKNENKNFKVIDVPGEFNYSKINNIAVDNSKCEYIMLLNNDTEVITPNWLELMLGYASQKHIGAVGVKLLYPNKQVQHCGVVLGIRGVAAHAGSNAYWNDPGLYGRYIVPYNYSAVTAACLLIKKNKYKEVNGLEEKLKVTFNDVDFNIKLLKKGYYNICLPMVELYHYESKSRGLDITSEKYKRFLTEVEYINKKWKDELKNDKYYNKNFGEKITFTLDKK